MGRSRQDHDHRHDLECKATFPGSDMKLVSIDCLQSIDPCGNAILNDRNSITRLRDIMF